MVLITKCILAFKPNSVMGKDLLKLFNSIVIHNTVRLTHSQTIEILWYEIKAL